MSLLGVNYTGDYGLARLGVVFDPASLTVASLASTAIGGAVSAAGTLAGGDAASQAAQMQRSAAYANAAQLDSNAAQAFASGQRKMFDTQQRTRMAISTSRARAGASGVDAGSGSPLENEQELGQRGSYQALMDLFNGESEASGLRNKAAAERYSGDVDLEEGAMKKKASQLAAFGTLAGTAGSMFKSYGEFAYPSQFGRTGRGL